MQVELISDAAASRIAHVLGGASAMALAIKDRDERRSRGENAGIFLTSDKTILVGPIPDPRT